MTLDSPEEESKPRASTAQKKKVGFELEKNSEHTIPTSDPDTGPKQQLYGDLRDLASQGDKFAAEIEDLRHDVRRAAEHQRSRTDADLFERANKEQKEAWLAINQYKRAVEGDLINFNLHTTPHSTTHSYYVRINDYCHARFPEGTFDEADYTWWQTVQLELNAAWLSQANLLISVIRRIRDKKIGGRFETLVHRVLICLEKFLQRVDKNFKAVWNKEECKPLTLAELYIPTETLFMGERLIRAVHLLYQ